MTLVVNLVTLSGKLSVLSGSIFVSLSGPILVVLVVKSVRYYLNSATARVMIDIKAVP
jgi:hypothetical protein